jgi:tetratricopeptide (TPR) repeat protein
MALEFKRGGASSLQWAPMLVDAVKGGAVDEDVLDALEQAGDSVGTTVLADAYGNAARQGLELSSSRWVKWAVHLGRNGMRPDAIRDLMDVVKNGSTDVEVVRTLVEMQVEAGQFDGAAGVLDAWAERPSVRSSRTEQPVVLYLRGKLALARGQRPQAIDAYRRSMTLDTSYVPNLVALTTLLVGQGDFEDADRVASVALQHQGGLRDNQERAQLLRMIGDIKARLGDETRAKMMRDRADVLDKE